MKTSSHNAAQGIIANNLENSIQSNPHHFPAISQNKPTLLTAIHTPIPIRKPHATLPLPRRRQGLTTPLLLAAHLGQPTRRRNPRLLIDRAQQRRQTLQDIPNRPAHVLAARLLARVPHRDLRLQAVDRLRVRLGQLLVRVALQHHVLEQALRAAQHRAHVLVRLRLLRDALGLLLGGVESGLGLARGPEVGRLGVLLLRVERGVGALGGGLEAGLGVLLLLVEPRVGGLVVGVELRVGLLLRRLAVDLGVHQVRGAAALELHLRPLRLDVALQFGVFGFGLPRGLDVGQVDAHVELGLGFGELGVGFGFFGFALRFEHGGCGVDFGDCGLGESVLILSTVIPLEERIAT